ncbi:MAG: hypothetical protein AABX88_00285 [Nanoarchaeota archaeon]
MSEIIVSKYGGKTLTTKEGVEKVKEITYDDDRRKIVVVSAIGQENGFEDRTTQLLVKLSQTKDRKLIDRIKDKYSKVYPNQTTEIINLEKELARRVDEKGNLSDGAYEDRLKAFGEEANAKFMAAKFGWEYIDPKEIFLVTNDFGNAKILPESQKMITDRLKDAKKPVVVPGFFGYTRDNQIATFDYGGGDITGAVISEALEALVYENYTNENGIFSANPDMIKPKKPAKIEEITFSEMRDLSYSGFGVFHPEAIAPVKRAGIPVHLRNPKDYPKVGTYIVTERISNPEKPIIGIAYKEGFCSFDIDSDGLNEEIGIGAEILNLFARKKIPYEFFPGSIDDVSVILKQNYFPKTNDIGKTINGLKKIVGNNSSVEFRENLGVIAIAGKGLKNRVGISAEVENVLAGSGVNIAFKVQGVKERCMIYGINSKDGKTSMNALLDKYDYLLDNS